MEAELEAEMTDWKLLYAQKLIAEKAATAEHEGGSMRPSGLSSLR